MPKPKNETGDKNLIAERLKELRINSKPKISQRELAKKLQLKGLIWTKT